MDPFMPDWVIDLRNKGYGGPYGAEFSNWMGTGEVPEEERFSHEGSELILQLLGDRETWKALPEKFRKAVERELDHYQEDFESWLMETYPEGVPC